LQYITITVHNYYRTSLLQYINIAAHNYYSTQLLQYITITEHNLMLRLTVNKKNRHNCTNRSVHL